MTHIRSSGRIFEKCIDSFTGPIVPRYFSITAHRGRIVGEKLLPYRIKKSQRAAHIKYHPIGNEIRDEEELRAIPRSRHDVAKWEFRQFYQFAKMPQYKAFFERNLRKKSRGTSEFGKSPELEDILISLHHFRDTYEARNYLECTDFSRVPLTSRRWIYDDMWRRSARVTPNSIAEVLRLAATWIRIGVKPGNLFSEAYRLLPADVSRETIVLCAFYKGLGQKMSLPRDDVVFPVFEEYLLAEGSTLTLFELESFAGGFYRSYEPFSYERNLQLCGVVTRRFLELLPSNPWNMSHHMILKLLKFNYHFNLKEMQGLQPALEASGFFEFCLEFPRFGMHQLMVLLGFLQSRRFKDEALLAKCVDTLKMLREKEDSLRARGKDFARLYSTLIQMGVKLDDEEIDFALNYFRQHILASDEDLRGRCVFIFLDALALINIFPHDMIDAFFSSEEFMLVEGGEMPAMTERGRGFQPFHELLMFDECLSLMSPDYAGARLPAQVRKLAEDSMKERDRRHYHQETEIRLAAALNKVFNKSRKTPAEEFVSIDRPFAHFMHNFILVTLDGKNKPVSSSQKIASGKRSGRKDKLRRIAISVTSKKTTLTSYDGVSNELKPTHHHVMAVIEKLGYEVVTVGYDDSLNIVDEEYCAWFATNLASRICKTKRPTHTP